MENENTSTEVKQNADEVMAAQADAEELTNLEAELETAGDASEPVLTDADLEAAVDAADKVSAKQEEYADQDATVESDGELEAAAEGATAPKKRSSKRDSYGSTFEAVTTIGGDNMPALDDAAINGLNKKSSEKAINIAEHVGAEKNLSVYTSKAAKLLKSEGEITMEQLVKHFGDQGYKIGTARSQTSQIFQLFPAFDVATRDGGKLVAKADNGLLDKLAV